jgi:hypothetical protein
MVKVDYQRDLKEYYAGNVDVPVIVNVPKMNFLMVDGKGDPNTSQVYRDAIQALYSVAYTIKFLCKNKYGQNFGVMPLEGLWWTESMADFNAENKSNWLWTAMIMQPAVVTKEKFKEAIELVRKRKASKLLDKVRFGPYVEGRSAQVMHIGPYADEGPTILKLHDYLKAAGGKLDSNRHHHEIYLNDPSRTNPSKLKTIIRQPF